MRLALALLACFAAEAQPPSRVYVYAPSQTAARAWQPVFCDADLVAEIRRGLYFAIELPPGRHALAVAK